MLLDWYIYNDTACDQLGAKNANNATICSPFVNIFLDTNVLRGTTDPTKPGDNNIPTTPVFSWNATANNLADNRPGIPAFRTSMTLLTLFGSGVTNQQDYPFDRYYCDLFVFAQDSSTNDTVGVRIFSTSGVAVGYTAVTQRASNNQDALPDINDRVAISRTGLVKAYALVIVMTMWAITLVFVMTTILAVFFGYRMRIELLAIPVSTLFAFPQLRSSMPGSPLGGTIIDYVGVLPCLALTSVCAALTLGLLVFVDPENNREHIIKPKGANPDGQQIEEKESDV